LDVLKVINELNRIGSSEGEGEGMASGSPTRSPISQELIDRAMAADLSSLLDNGENEGALRRQSRVRRTQRV